MTELEQKAEEYCRQDDLGHFIHSTEEVKQAYITGALSRQTEIEELKKIEEEYYDFIQKKNEEDWKGDNVVGCLNLKIKQLEAQIEKMKCCENCKQHRFWGNELGCKLDLDKQFECDNNNHKYWELGE